MHPFRWWTVLSFHQRSPWSHKRSSIRHPKSHDNNMQRELLLSLVPATWAMPWVPDAWNEWWQLRLFLDLCKCLPSTKVNNKWFFGSRHDVNWDLKIKKLNERKVLSVCDVTQLYHKATKVRTCGWNNLIFSHLEIYASFVWT